MRSTSCSQQLTPLRTITQTVIGTADLLVWLIEPVAVSNQHPDAPWSMASPRLPHTRNLYVQGLAPKEHQHHTNDRSTVCGDNYDQGVLVFVSFGGLSLPDLVYVSRRMVPSSYTPLHLADSITMLSLLQLMMLCGEQAIAPHVSHTHAWTTITPKDPYCHHYHHCHHLLSLIVQQTVLAVNQTSSVVGFFLGFPFDFFVVQPKLVKNFKWSNSSRNS